MRAAFERTLTGGRTPFAPGGGIGVLTQIVSNDGPVAMEASGGGGVIVLQAVVG